MHRGVLVLVEGLKKKEAAEDDWKGDRQNFRPIILGKNSSEKIK